MNAQLILATNTDALSLNELTTCVDEILEVATPSATLSTVQQHSLTPSASHSRSNYRLILKLSKYGRYALVKE